VIEGKRRELIDGVPCCRRRVTAGEPIPDPPFWGARVLESAPKAVVPFINERSLYQFQWGFRKQGRSLDDFLGWAKQELRPVMRRMLALCEAEDILKPQAAYGYWLAAGQGNDLIIFEQDGTTERARFTLPRQPKEDGECIADFFRDVDDIGSANGAPARDVTTCRPITSRACGSRRTATRTISISTVFPSNPPKPSPWVETLPMIGHSEIRWTCSISRPSMRRAATVLVEPVKFMLEVP